MSPTTAPAASTHLGRQRRRRPTGAGLPVIAGALAVALVSACTGGGSDEPQPTPAPTTPPVAQDLASLSVPRAEFCDRADLLVVRAGLPDSLRASASASTAASTAPEIALVAWTNGDKLEGREDGDVSHEFGCRWTLPGRPSATAAAWVFVPPVDATRAGTLGQRIGQIDGATCRPLQGSAPATGFGTAAVAVACATTGKPNPARASVRWAGLFGDAWLVCETTGPQARPRAEQFCPALVTAIAQDD